MAKQTRSYRKQSSYWTERKAVAAPAAPKAPPAHDTSTASFDSNPHFTAISSCGGGNRTGYQTNWAPTISQTQRYANIMGGVLPFAQNNGYYDVSQAINLAVLAYFNVGLVRNCVSLLQDFSVSPLHLKCPNRTVKAFFTKWLEMVNMPSFMSQFFLEYYRSGNVFIYRFNGKMDEDKVRKLKTVTAATVKPTQIPIRYTLLNPMQVYLQVGPGQNNAFSKMLSTFEIERLRDPKTPEDKEVLKSFSPEIQKQIKTSSSLPYVFVPLDTSRLYYAFYRKQDYEPLAVPMIFPVLADIDFKLEMKKADLSMVRQLEQVFLLVTSGDRRDENNPGVDPRKIVDLQKIFSNQTIGRALVGDYTLNAKWINPDLKDLWGEQKYAQVDKDIKDGLGYAFFGPEKLAGAIIKAKIFVACLKEGRRLFLDNFLRPQMKEMSTSLGFKNVPTVEFEEIDITDQAALQRVYVQMAQLGLLTPTQLNKALESGVLPEDDNQVPDQEAYKKERDDGLYMPLIGAPQQGDMTGGNGRPSGPGKSMPSKSPAKKTKGDYQFSMRTVAESISNMGNVRTSVEAAYRKAAKLKKLTPEQEAVALAVTKSIVVNEPADKWQEAVATYIKDPKNVPEDIGRELDEIGARFDVDGWTAIALHRSKVEKTE